MNNPIDPTHHADSWLGADAASLAPATSTGLLGLIAVLLIAYTLVSERIKWYHTVCLVFAGVLIGGLGAYPTAVRIMNGIGGVTAAIATNISSV